MPQPFNWKNSDVRIAETIQFIQTAGHLPAYAAVAASMTAWSNNAAHAAAKQAMSTAMHQGFHWEKGRADASKVARKANRDRRRAILMMRVMIQGDTVEQAEAALGRVEDARLAGEFDRLVGQCGALPVIDLNLPSGRMQRSGLLNPGNMAQAFFATQDALFVHFRDNVMPTIQNAMTRAVYRAALLTVGNTVWGPGEGNGPAKVRFNAFDATVDGQRLIVNCWEALLFWACRANALTVAACRKLYDEYDVNDKSRRIRSLFGTQTAFDPLTVNPGDVLTWINGPHMNHVGMYAGVGPAPHNTPWLFHNLALNAARDHVGGGLGTTHFRTVAHMDADYLGLYGAATCYHNQPFWVAQGNTAEYQYRQHLMAP